MYIVIYTYANMIINYTVCIYIYIHACMMYICENAACMWDIVIYSHGNKSKNRHVNQSQPILIMKNRHEMIDEMTPNQPHPSSGLQAQSGRHGHRSIASSSTGRTWAPLGWCPESQFVALCGSQRSKWCDSMVVFCSATWWSLVMVDLMTA